MASPADADAPVNGPVAEASPSESQSGPTTKRKREPTDDGLSMDDDAKPIINGGQPLRDEKTLIRNYFDVLQRYGQLSPSAAAAVSAAAAAAAASPSNIVC